MIQAFTFRFNLNNTYLSGKWRWMWLILSIGSKVLDSIKLDPKRVKDEDYLHSLKRLLHAKNELAIIAWQREPSYYIEVPPDVDDTEFDRNA